MGNRLSADGGVAAVSTEMNREQMLLREMAKDEAEIARLRAQVAAAREFAETVKWRGPLMSGAEVSRWLLDRMNEAALTSGGEV